MKYRVMKYIEIYMREIYNYEIQSTELVHY